MTKFLVPFVIILGILLALRLGGVFDAWPIPPEPAPSPTEINTLGVTVTPSVGGAVTPSGGRYTSGTELALTATAADGYTFDHWSGGASGSAPVTTVTMGSDRNVTAHFEEISIPPQGGNAPPVICSLAADKSQVAPSGSCQIQCTASDEDDDSLAYTWSATAGDLSGTGSTVTWQAPQQYEACDVTVIVEDGEGGIAEASLTLSVVANQPPQISSLDANPSALSPGSSTTITCIATDPDGDAVSYSWSASQGNISGTGNNVTWVAPSETGSFTVTVLVADGKGGETKGNVSIDVLPPPPPGNQPPVISRLTAAQVQVCPLGSTEIQCVASDADGDSLTYTWSANGGSLGGGGSTVTWQAPQQYGACDVTVIVEDGEGGIAEASLTLSVVADQPPSSYLAESYHPYANNYEHTWTISEPGVSEIRIHFSKIEIDPVHRTFDYLYVLDEDNHTLTSWRSVAEEDIWTQWYTGDTLKVKLYTDSGTTAFGFIVDQVETRAVAVPPSSYLAESYHPYANNYEHTWTISEPGVSEIRIHFSKIEIDPVHRTFDYLYVLDEDNHTLTSWRSVAEEDIWTQWYTGDTLKVKLYTDSGTTAFGFIVDQVETRTGET